MDFKTLAAPKDGLCAVAADALLVLIAGDTLPGDVDPALGTALTAAIEGGDLA